MIEAVDLVIYAAAVVVSFAVVGVGFLLTIKGMLHLLRKKD